MKVQISCIKNEIYHKGADAFDAVSVSTDPERRYAVAEIAPRKYVAIRITAYSDECVAGEYVDHYFWDDDTPELQSFSTDWSCIPYGFCKLRLWAPEKVREFGGHFDKTLKRFYFDRELYKASYEEINGVPFEDRHSTVKE